MKSRLFVDNLPSTATVESLTQHFSNAGKVNRVTLVLNKVSGKPERHCFIQMGSAADASKAIQLFNKTAFEKSTLTVTHAGPINQRDGFSGVSTTEERKNR